MAKVEDEMKELEEKLKKTTEELEKEAKIRKDLEAQNVKLLQEKNDLFIQLEAERGGSGDLEERLQRMITQKADLESQFQVCKRILLTIVSSFCRCLPDSSTSGWFLPLFPPGSSVH